MISFHSIDNETLAMNTTLTVTIRLTFKQLFLQPCLEFSIISTDFPECYGLSKA